MSQELKKSKTQYSARDNGAYRFEAGVDRQILSFINLLERKYISTESETRPVDLAEKIQFFILDAISDISLSEPFGYLDNDHDMYKYNEINRSSLSVLNVVSILPWLASLVHKWPLRLLLPREGDKVGFGRIME